MGTAADDLSPAPTPPSRSGAVPAPARAPSRDRAPWPPTRQPESGDNGAGAPTTSARATPSPAKARPAPAAALAPIAERRYRQTINRVDLWSVLKVAVCFYICSMAVLMVALVALWVIGDAAGVIGNVERFLGDLLQTKDFTFLDGEILPRRAAHRGGARRAAHRGHGDRGGVLQPVRRDLRWHRAHDQRGRDRALRLATPLGAGEARCYSRSPSGAIAQSVRAHP